MSSGKVAVMALAMVGRMAHYVLEGGETRPMMLVNVTGGELANGIVFLDITNDPPAESHDGAGVKVPFMSVSSAGYDPHGATGTWHWPDLAQHVEADGANVMEHVHDALAKFRSELLGHVNTKLETHIEAVGKLADGMSTEFQEHVRKLGSDVAAEADKVLSMKAPASVERVDVSLSRHQGAPTGVGGIAPSAADLDAVAAEQRAANATTNAAADAAEATQQPGAEVGHGG